MPEVRGNTSETATGGFTFVRIGGKALSRVFFTSVGQRVSKVSGGVRGDTRRRETILSVTAHSSVNSPTHRGALFGEQLFIRKWPAYIDERGCVGPTFSLPVEFSRYGSWDATSSRCTLFKHNGSRLTFRRAHLTHPQMLSELEQQWKSLETMAFFNLLRAEDNDSFKEYSCAI